MKHIIRFVFLSLVISGCTADNQDLVDYINEVKARKNSLLNSVPDMARFITLHYSATGARNPFSNPFPESVTEAPFQQDCPQPNFARIKDPLEIYSLDNLNMQGTLGNEELLWGLIRINSGEVFRVSAGDYIGLHHGEILGITKNHIELSELILTEKDCWQIRITQIFLSSKDNI